MSIRLPPAPRRLLLLGVLAAGGCELFAYADRREITSTGGGGASSSSGADACAQPADCPGADTDCSLRICDAGACDVAFVMAGTPTGNQLAGDCKRAVCDGHGAETLADDPLDVPVDGDDCTDDRCTGGVPSNPRAGAGTPCAAGGGKVCDGAGSCVACVTQDDCDAGLACVNNVCG